MDPKLEELAQFLLDCSILEFKIDCIMGRVGEDPDKDQVIDHIIKNLLKHRLKNSTINGATTCIVNESH